MRNIVLIFLLLNLTASLATESVVMRFYSKNGSDEKIINASETSKIVFSQPSDYFSFLIHHSSNQKAEYLIKNIDSIIFSKNENDINFMSVFITGIENKFQVSNIDSLIYVNLVEVTIGSQTWMKKNLDVTKYRNGDNIRYAANLADWLDAAAKKEGAWCYLDNNGGNNSAFGKLYNWYAVNDPRGLAPEGWKVPSNNDWASMVSYLGGISVAGGKLKETGLTYWASPNTDATNITGFAGRPGGMRGFNGIFYQHAQWGNYWSATSRDSDASFSWKLNSSSASIENYGELKATGYSVRCIKD